MYQCHPYNNKRPHWKAHSLHGMHIGWQFQMFQRKMGPAQVIVSMMNENSAATVHGSETRTMFNGWWCCSHPSSSRPQHPSSCGMSLSAVEVTTFQTDLSNTGSVKWCYYIRSFPAAKVVLSVTKLHVSDRPPHKSRARGRDFFFDEISWELDCKMQKCAAVNDVWHQCAFDIQKCMPFFGI